jgi:flagellar basal-body rod protein FlgF
MSAALYLSSVGARARMSQLEMVSNNLANADTPGYKADEPLFSAALGMALEGENGRRHEGALQFVTTPETRVRHESGPLAHTGRNLDVAIQGDGFFLVQTPEGIRYTRAGALSVNADGKLAGPGGHALMGTSGPISAGSGGVRVERDGSVVSDAGAVLGRLQLEEFLEPEKLQKQGESLFVAPIDLVGIPVDGPQLEVGSLEQSNVEPVHELAKLLILQRAYDASMQALATDDRVSGRLIEEMTP